MRAKRNAANGRMRRNRSNPVDFDPKVTMIMMQRTLFRGCRARFELFGGILVLALAAATGCGDSGAPKTASAPGSFTQVAVTTGTQTQAAKENASTSKTASPAILARMKDAVATSKLGDLTRADILEDARFALVEPLQKVPTDDETALEQITAVSNSDLTTVARWIVSRQASYQDFKTNASASNRKKIEEAFDIGQRRKTITTSVLQTELYDKLPRISDADLNAYYEQHKAQYKEPFQFYMRYLILLTYENYVVKDGDTLESIAARISGDKERAGDIRWDTEQRPLRREAGKTFRPLAAGEKLLVPMDEAAAQQVKQRLEGLLKQIDTKSTATLSADKPASGTKAADKPSTATFELIARQYSMSSPPGEVIGPLPSGTKEMLPEIMKYAKDTPEGGISPVFRTPHGWQAIQIVKKRDDGVLPLSSVRDEMRDTILHDAQTHRSADLITEMYANPRLTVDYDSIGKMGDSLSTTTIVATLGDEKLPWNLAKPLWIRFNKPKDRDAILTALKGVRELQQMLIVDMARDDIKTSGSAVSKAVEAARMISEGQAWLVSQALIAAQSGITSQTLTQFYDANKEKYFKASPKVTYMSMERRLTPEQRQKVASQREDLTDLYNQFKKDVDGLKTAEDFKAKAAELNAKLAGQLPAPASLEAPTALDQLEPLIKSQIDNLKPGQWTPPFLIDNNFRLASILLLTKEETGYRPYAEVQNDVYKLVIQQTFEHELKKLTDQRLAQVDFKMVP